MYKSKFLKDLWNIIISIIIILELTVINGTYLFFYFSAAEKVLRLSHSSIDPETNQVTVSCRAEDMYPKPTIIIRQDK